MESQETRTISGYPKGSGRISSRIHNRTRFDENEDTRLHILGDYNADNYMRSGNAFYNPQASHIMQEVSAIPDTPTNRDMVARYSDHLQRPVSTNLPPSAPNSTYTDNLVKHDHHQSTENNRQSISLIPRAAKKLLLTPSPSADNGTFTSMPSPRDASISLIEDNDYNERGENPVTPKSRSKKLLEKIVPSLKTTPHRPETPEMDPKAEQFFGKGSHERKKSHLFDKFKNKGPARQIQFEEAPTPLRHKHSRLPADLTDSPFWDVKQAQKQRIRAIRDARIAENQQGGDQTKTSIARSTSLRYINDEMPPTPPSKDQRNLSAVLESDDPRPSTQRLQSTVVRSNTRRFAEQDVDPGMVSLPHVKHESVRIHQGSPTRNGGCAVKDRVKLIEHQISYNSLSAEMKSNSPPPPVPPIPAALAGDTHAMRAATNINHQQTQTPPSTFLDDLDNLVDAQIASTMDAAAIPTHPTADLVGNTSVAETINHLRHARQNSTVFSIPEEDVEDTAAGGSDVFVDPSNILPACRQGDLTSRSVSPSNYSTYTIGMPIPFPDVVDMVNDNLRQGYSTRSGNRSSLAPPPLRVTSRSTEPVQEQPAADSSQRQSSVSWQSATSWNNEVNERILRLEFRVDLLLSSAVMLVHNFRYLRDIQEDMQHRAAHLEQLVNRMVAGLGGEPAPAASAPADTPAPADAPAPVDAPVGRRNSVIQRLTNVVRSRRH